MAEHSTVPSPRGFLIWFTTLFVLFIGVHGLALWLRQQPVNDSLVPLALLVGYLVLAQFPVRLILAYLTWRLALDLQLKTWQAVFVALGMLAWEFFLLSGAYVLFRYRTLSKGRVAVTSSSEN